MSRRFFVDHEITGDTVELTGPEAHHLLHVVRAQPGDEVVVFDGRGGEYSAEVVSVGRSSVTLRVVNFVPANRELATPIELGVALPKGDRQKWLVEKAVEIGVARLTPLVTERGVAQPTGSALDRLRRAVIEASKQCGRNRLLEIGEPQSLGDYFKRPDSKVIRWLAHPGGEPIGAPEGSHATSIQLAIGPEGGFTDGEIELARNASCRIVNLGPRILRVETAAIVLVVAATIGQPF